MTPTPPPRKEEDPLNYQVGGEHYHQYAYQPIELIHDLNLDFDRANAVKYLVRLGKKEDKPIQDIRKAQHYLRFYEARQIDSADKVEMFVTQVEDPLAAMAIRCICYGDVQLAQVMITDLIKRYGAVE